MVATVNVRSLRPAAWNIVYPENDAVDTTGEKGGFYTHLGNMDIYYLSLLYTRFN